MSEIIVTHQLDIATELTTKVDLDISFQFGWGHIITAAAQTLIEVSIFRSDIKKLKGAIAEINAHINKIYKLIANMQKDQIVQRDTLLLIASKFEYSDRVNDYFYVLERLNGEIKPSSDEFNILIGSLIQNNRKLESCCSVLKAETERRLKESANSDWNKFLKDHGPETESYIVRETVSTAAREYIRFVMLSYSNSVLALMNVPLMTNISDNEKIEYIMEIRKSLNSTVINSYGIWEKWIRLSYMVWWNRIFVGNPPVGPENPYEPYLIMDYLEVGYLSIETSTVSVTHTVMGTISPKGSLEYAEAEKEIIATLDAIAHDRRLLSISLTEKDVSP